MIKCQSICVRQHLCSKSHFEKAVSKELIALSHTLYMLVLFCSFWLLRGNTPETRGTAYVVYEDIFDAKNACDHLSGFNVCNRYLVVLYYNANRVCVNIFMTKSIHHQIFSLPDVIKLYFINSLQAFQKMDTKKKEEQLKLLKEKYGINTDPPK